MEIPVYVEKGGFVAVHRDDVLPARTIRCAHAEVTLSGAVALCPTFE